MLYNPFALVAGSRAYDDGRTSENNPYDYAHNYKMWASWNVGFHDRKQQITEQTDSLSNKEKEEEKK